MTDTAQMSVSPREIRIPAEAGIALVLVIVMFIGALASPHFLTLSNMMVLLLNGVQGRHLRYVQHLLTAHPDIP